jgi:hypothetical protein
MDTSLNQFKPKARELEDRFLAEGADAHTVRRFLRWHMTHKDVWKAFESLCFYVIGKGKDKCGSMAILNKVRWDVEIEFNQGELKCPNDWAPYFARIFCWKHPQHAGLFNNKQLGRGRNDG